MVHGSKTLLGLIIAASSPFVDAYWRMSCSIVQTGRVDPIVNPGAISGHVHKVSGASNFGLSSTYESMRASQCTTCEVGDDKSNYWTPQLYYQHANGSFEEVPNSGTIIYYLGRGDNRSNIEPFPNGFKMLSGNPSLRSYDTKTMTANNTQKSRLLADRVSFACIDSSGNLPEQPYMFRTDCNQGMRAQVHFPTCWNGGDYKADQSHVAHLSQIDNGVCPPTHPRQFVHLFYEIYYWVNNIKKDGGRFVFSNGDTTGYGFHGDFMNGWEPTTLKTALKQCANDDTTGGQVSACPPLAKSQTPYFATNCPERAPIVQEKVKGWLSKLPGCNNVTSGPGPVPQAVCSVQPGYNNVTDSGSYTMFNPLPGDKLGTFAYTGCVKELPNARSLSKYSVSMSNMTIETCTSICKSQGYPLAGVEYSTECWCTDTLTSGASLMNATACATTPMMICGGNASQWCGASSLLHVWNNTAYTPPTPLVVNQTKIANGSAVYLGCYAEPSNTRALSAASTVDNAKMTNELCVAYCKSKGYTFAGSEYSAECWCGNNIGGTKISDITQCSMKCTGDNQQYCGGSSKLSVWQLQSSGSSGSGSSGSGSSGSGSGSSSNQRPTTAANGTALYIGCYTDSGSRTLSGPNYAADTMTVDSCAAYCKTQNYPLFGVEYGRECYCGSATKTDSSKVAESDCSMTCKGNSTQYCGAGARLSVWNNTLYTATRNPTSVNNGQYNYVGCYTEGTNGRALSAASMSNSKMTVEMCGTFCNTRGYNYMGVEYGVECYCSKSAPGLGSTTTPASQCNMACAGDTSEWCGAGSRLSVYKYPSTTMTTARSVPKEKVSRSIGRRGVIDRLHLRYLVDFTTT